RAGSAGVGAGAAADVDGQEASLQRVPGYVCDTYNAGLSAGVHPSHLDAAESQAARQEIQERVLKLAK
ncbi:hypothetical protein, partial [Escherichia coli]|uniref:hypothetical protein n=1 Tax=Escherichia coli TaxID=562 RepID=UPI002738F3A3